MIFVYLGVVLLTCFQMSSADYPRLPRYANPDIVYETKRQLQDGCLCVSAFYFSDPHCGTDGVTYDNGCFFDCAQRRKPSLELVKWSRC